MMKRLIVLPVVLSLLIGADFLWGQHPTEATDKQTVELQREVQELKSKLTHTKNSLLDWQCRACELETQKLMKQSERLRNDKQEGTGTTE